MRITLILPTITQPRFQKRLKSLSKEHKLNIFAFDRGLYKKNSIDFENVKILGEMKNKNYLKRFSIYYTIIKTILSTRKNTDLFYFFTFDFALLGFLLLKRNQYVYEIGDFAYLSLPKSIVNILTYLDLRIIKNSYRTILTSEGFKNYLNEKSKKTNSNLIVIPNKPPVEILKFPRKTHEFKSANKLRFGFVGILRYPNTVFKIVKLVAKKFPQHEFVFYGDGGLKNQFLELTKKYKNLHYKGQFKNPDDLGKIYDEFDIHIACYDITGLNQKLAEPNKLYESIYFGNPIIATKNSFFGDKVSKSNIGYTLSDFSDNNLQKFLEKIDIESLNNYRKNMINNRVEDLIDSDKHLLSELQNFNRK